MSDLSALDLKVDVEVLKTQVSTLTRLCDKMDQLIEKVVDNQDKLVNQLYNEMNDREKSTTEDIKDLHSRITTVDRNLSDKIELTERRIMEEIKQLRSDIAEHNRVEDRELKKILEWKWMAAGGIIVAVWAITHFDTVMRIFN